MTASVSTEPSPFDHPALVRCGKRFWTEMAKVAVSVPLPDVLPTDNEFRRNLLAQKREADILRIPAQVALTQVAEWVDLPPEYARGYLRAVHHQLEACGLVLLERRLGAADTLGFDLPYGGEGMSKRDKVALERAANAAAQEAKSAAREHKRRVSEMRRAERALTAAEKRVARGKEGDDLDALTAALTTVHSAVDAAAAAIPPAEQARDALNDRLANVQFLPLSRMGYAPIRNTPPNGARP